MRRLAAFACASSLWLAASAPPLVAQEWMETSRLPKTHEQPLERDPMGVTVHRLANGLTAYLSPSDQDPRITAWIAVRAGSAHDPDDSTGMAHYLEHMLFKGSRRLGTLDYEKEKPHLDRMRELYEKLFEAGDPERRKEIYAEIDRENQAASRHSVPNEMDKTYKTLGIRKVNAFTSNERTVYICDMPKNRLEAWARLEGDRFAGPIFRLFQTEIETVYEEKNRSLDNPDRILSDALERGLYKDHPYGRTVLGSVEHLKNPSLAKMYAFYGDHYVPNNMAVVLAGDFDRKEALAVIEKYLGRWKPRALPEPPERNVPRPAGVERVEVKYEAEEKIFLAWPTVSKLHPDAEALRVMDMVFDNAESGVVNLRLNQAQKVKSAGSHGDARNEAGAWVLWALPKDGQTLEQAEALLLETVAAVQNGEFSEEDLKANILNYEIGQKRQTESNDGRTWAISDAFVSYEEWPRRVDRLKRIRAVSKADVVRVANKYLGADRVAVLRRKAKPEIPSMPKPEFTKVEIDPGRESAFFRDITGMPAEPIEPKWVEKGRDYILKKLPSGRFYWVKNPMNDLFSIEFWFDRGSRHERRLCAALDLLEKSGAGELSAGEFKRKLYGLGVQFDMSCYETSSGLRLSGIEENVARALELVRLRFREPNIAPGTLEKMVEIQIGQHKDNKVDPRHIGAALAEFAQRGERSAYLNELDDDELRALKETELVEILRGVFDYERRVGYVGTLPAAEVAELLERPGKKYLPAPKRSPMRYLKPEKTRVVFVHRDMVQSQVGIFAADGIFSPRRYVDYRFYSTYMGGGMSAVIFQEVREARSLAYSAWGGYRSGRRKGDENRIVAGLGTQADKTIEATEVLHTLLREMPASEERLEEARKAIEQDYRTNPVQFRDVAGAVMEWEDRGLRRDPRPRRMKKAMKYRLKDLERFAKRFRDSPMTIHILGNRERVDFEALKKMGDFTEKSVDDLFPY
ncbi:MAG: insulinase family protein [Elusimicrobiota bacterium]